MKTSKCTVCNVKFVGIRKARSEYTKFDAVSLQIAQNISSAEERIGDYGEQYKYRQIYEW